MVLFSTKFALSESFSREDFLEILRDWIASLDTCDLVMDYHDEPEYEAGSSDDKSKLSIYAIDDTLAVQLVQQDDVAIYTSTYVITKVDESLVMFIRLEKSLFQAAGDDFVLTEIPRVMKELFWREYGGDDHGILTDDRPYQIRKADVDFANRVLSGDIRFFNPIVYVSVDRNTGSCAIDCNSLSCQLIGVAHVLVESNPYIAGLISEVSGDKNPDFGDVLVMLPGGDSKLFDSRSYLDKTFLVSEIVRYVYQAMAGVVVEDVFSFQKIRMQYLLSKASDNAELGSICDELLRDKDAVIADLKVEIDNLKSSLSAAELKSGSMENALQNSKFKNALHNSVLLKLSSEKDCYDGECRDIVLKLIAREVRAMKDDSKLCKSRKFDVLSDIANTNALTNIDEHIMAEFKRITENGTFSASNATELERMGFSVAKGKNNHYKIAYNGDVRYQFSASSTPSDFRAGENLASSYMNMLFGY